MKNHLHIQRHRTDEFWLKALTYSVARLENGGVSAIMACNEGHNLTLTSHKIDSDGTVTPSVGCPRNGCFFHEYVKLVGWTGT